MLLIIICVYAYLIAISINDEYNGFDCGIKFKNGKIV